MNNFKRYKRKGSIEARPYEHGDQSRTEISFSEADLNRNTLAGGYVARNPDNPKDQWYINPDYFTKNYTE